MVKNILKQVYIHIFPYLCSWFTDQGDLIVLFDWLLWNKQLKISLQLASNSELRYFCFQNWGIEEITLYDF